MKQLNENFTDAEYSRLKEAKGDRTWREAILAEFGVDADE